MKKRKAVYVVCASAKIYQEFIAEDMSLLLLDMSALICAEKRYSRAQETVIRFRVSEKDKQRIEQRALKAGYTSVSKYIREEVLAYYL